MSEEKKVAVASGQQDCSLVRGIGHWNWEAAIQTLDYMAKGKGGG